MINTKQLRRIPRSLGFAGYALSFDGMDDHISVETHWNALIGTSDFTIEARVKGGPNTTFRGIVGTYADAANPGLWLDRWLNRFRLRIKAAGTPWGFVDITSNPQADNQWHHVVAVGNRDGNGYIYVNGTLENQRDISAHSGLISDDPIRIGRMLHTFNGLIDIIRIYNQAWSPNPADPNYLPEIDPGPPPYDW